MCYAYIAIITAYMSCHWTEEFYAALLNAFILNSDKVKEYLSQASKRGIKLLLPDINLSECNFKAENGNIRFGLQGISGLKKEAEYIVAERNKNGKFTSFYDFYMRMAESGCELKKTDLEGLIYSGALSSFSSNKNALLSMLDPLKKEWKKMANAFRMNQMSLFSREEMEIQPPDVPMMEESVSLQKEFESLGMYVSKHPTDDILSKPIVRKNYIAIEDLVKNGNAVKYKVRCFTIGMIRNLRKFYTKKGDQMAAFTLENSQAAIPCVIFPSNFEQCMGELREHNVIGVEGELTKNERNNNALQISVRNLFSGDSLTENVKPLKILITNKKEQNRVLRYIQNNPGNTPVVFETPNGKLYPVKCCVDCTLQTLDYLKGEYRKN